MKFKDYNGKVVSYEEIPSYISGDPSEYEVYVGTDSKVKKADKKVIYATCIILYRKGRGGRIFLSKEKKALPGSLRERLSMETWRSLEASMELTKLLPGVEIIIHVDVNKSQKYKSGQFANDLVSMVMGQGFKCAIKPEAFAAQSAADRFSKKDR